MSGHQQSINKKRKIVPNVNVLYDWAHRNLLNYNIVGIIKFLRCIGGKRSFVIVLDDEDQHTISPCVSKTILLRNSFNQLGLLQFFLLQMRPLFFSVSAMAKHENRQKFVTRVAKNVQVVVVMVINEIQKEALKINY